MFHTFVLCLTGLQFCSEQDLLFRLLFDVDAIFIAHLRWCVWVPWGLGKVSMRTISLVEWIRGIKETNKHDHWEHKFAHLLWDVVSRRTRGFRLSHILYGKIWWNCSRCTEAENWKLVELKKLLFHTEKFWFSAVRVLLWKWFRWTFGHSVLQLFDTVSCQCSQSSAEGSTIRASASCVDTDYWVRSSITPEKEQSWHQYLVTSDFGILWLWPAHVWMFSVQRCNNWASRWWWCPIVWVPKTKAAVKHLKWRAKIKNNCLWLGRAICTQASCVLLCSLC